MLRRQKWMRLFCVMLAGLLFVSASHHWVPDAASDSSQSVPEPQRELTLMIYMCGSNLESSYGSASADIDEMMKATFDAGRMSLLVMKGGTGAWQSGDDPGETAIHEIRNGRSRIVKRLPLMNMGASDTLAELLRFSREQYPAKRYALILWDHGGGPMEGVCWDELFSMDNLSLDELTGALTAAGFGPAPDGAEQPADGEKLSWIGFDACLMCSAEVAQAAAPYAEYMIASQETEPASGWDYHFLSELDPAGNGLAAGRLIVDTYFDSLADSMDPLTMACLDLSQIEGVRNEADSFFSQVSEQVTEKGFAAISTARMTSTGFGKATRGVGDNGYDLVDLKDLIGKYSDNGDGSDVRSALEHLVAYSRTSEDGAGGISVYHPYQNKQKYIERWRQDYQKLGFGEGYIRYLNKFGNLLTGIDLTDWSGMTTVITDVAEDGTNRLTLELTPEQAGEAVSAQLTILMSIDEAWGHQAGNSFALIGTENAGIENGIVTASYNGQALYAMDTSGKLLAGPVSFMQSDDGSYYLVRAGYRNYALHGTGKKDTGVLYHCLPVEEGRQLKIARTYVHDDATQTYSNRIPFSEDGFTEAELLYLIRDIPQAEGAIPGFDKWEQYGGWLATVIKLPVDWHLEFRDGWQSNDGLFAMFEVTDAHQNTWSSQPVRLLNPMENIIRISPETVEIEGVTFRFSAALKMGEKNPVLQVRTDVENHSGKSLRVKGDEWILNDTRMAGGSISFYSLKDGETDDSTLNLRKEQLTGIDKAETLSCNLEISDSEDWDAPPVQAHLQLKLENARVESISAPVSEAIAEAEQGDMTFQLVSLERDGDDRFQGLLHIVNETDEMWDSHGAMVMNGVKMEGSVSAKLAPHTDGYFSFQAEDADTLGRYAFKIQDSDRLYYLGVTEALAQAGVTEVTDLTIIWDPDYQASEDGNPVVLALREPVPVPQAKTSPIMQTILDTAEIRVDLENMLVANDGVGLGVRLENLTDAPIQLVMYSPATDGEVSNETQLHNYITVPGRCRAVVCLAINTRDKAGEALKDVQFVFRNGNQLSTPVTIHMPEGVRFGASGGTQLSAKDVEVVPGRWREDPAVVQDEVICKAEKLNPILVQAPLTAGEAEAAKSVSVSLCHLGWEETTDETGAVRTERIHREITGTLMEQQENGVWETFFCGGSVYAAGVPLDTLETRTGEGDWLIEPDEIYLYANADNYHPSGEGLYWDRGYETQSEFKWTVHTENDHTTIQEAVIRWRPRDYSDPRTNFYLSEYQVAATETRVFFGSDRMKYWQTIDYSEAVQLPLDKPIRLEMVPIDLTEDNLGLYYVILYKDGSRDDLIVDFTTGEILDRTHIDP